MNKKALVLLSIIGLVIVFLLYTKLYSSSVEKDIAQCSQDILSKANFPQLVIDTNNHGRDVMVSGFVQSENVKSNISALLKNKCNISSLENNIQITSAKPFKQAHINILFNENNELVNFSGTTSKETVETNFGFLMDSFKRAKNFKLSISSNKDIVPVNYHDYTSIVKPYFSQINAGNVTFNGTEITLRGNVTNEVIKLQIGQELKQSLGQEVSIINLLSVTEKKATNQTDNVIIHKPLDTNH